MNEDGLKLTTYFGERDRAERASLAAALVDVYARHAFRTSVLLRGAEGFGAGHRLQTARQLSLSEDLPLVAVAVDARERIEAALPDVLRLTNHGLLTLERARLLTGRVEAVRLPEAADEATKLTIFVGRRERVGRRPAHLAVVDALHGAGIAGATALLGVDGTAHGVRQRARFFAANADVPVMVISVGRGDALAPVVPQLGAMLRRPLMTLERVRVCKRDGRRLAEPQHLPDSDPSGLAVWQKLMVYASEQARHDGRPLYVQIVRALREGGAMGATAVRGFWGFHGDHAPHGDRLWTVRREVPVVTVVVDTPERSRRWFQIIDALTDETGLVTSEMVPASRAGAGPGGRGGPLGLARAP